MDYFDQLIRAKALLASGKTTLNEIRGMYGLPPLPCAEADKLFMVIA